VISYRGNQDVPTTATSDVPVTVGVPVFILASIAEGNLKLLLVAVP
jgi:hypothetical protein